MASLDSVEAKNTLPSDEQPLGQGSQKRSQRDLANGLPRPGETVARGYSKISLLKFCFALFLTLPYQTARTNLGFSCHKTRISAHSGLSPLTCILMKLPYSG